MDNYNLLQENIRKRIEVTDDEISYFIFLLQQKKYSRKELILRESEISHNFTFIVSGCVKSYLIDKKGEEHILTIAPSDWWITDINSFVSGTPGNLFMEALEPTTALLLSREKQELLLAKIPKFEKYFRILTEKAFAVSQQRIIDYMSLSALERLEKFVASYPSVISSLTQQQIASYIGVTPSFFSRMIKGKKIF